MKIWKKKVNILKMKIEIEIVQNLIIKYNWEQCNRNEDCQ